jgi:hypothetical protein
MAVLVVQVQKLRLLPVGLLVQGAVAVAAVVMQVPPQARQKRRMEQAVDSTAAAVVGLEAA